MSDVFDLTDAVAARINAGSYTISATFTAQGVALIEVDADEIVDNVLVECVPRMKRLEPLSRAKDRNEITIGVGVMKQIGVTAGKVTTSEVSALVELCEEIADQLKSQDYTVNGRSAKWIKTEIDPVYDSEALYDANQFRSIVNATYLLTTP